MFHEPSGILCWLPCVLGSVWSCPLIIKFSALAVSAPAAVWGTEVLESMWLSVFFV